MSEFGAGAVPAPARGPTRAPVPPAPGTLVAEVLEVWRLASCMANGALTSSDVRRVWSGYTGRPWRASTGAVVSPLLKRGLLVPALRSSSGLRTWHYEHVDLPPEPPACLDAQALAALSALAADGNAWVSTEAICRRLRDAGSSCESFRLGKALARLAEPDTARVLHHAAAAATGRLRHYWWPVDRAAPAPPPVAVSYRDAAIRAVEAARAALGCPPSPHEFEAWVLAQDPRDPLVAALARRPGVRPPARTETVDARRGAAANVSYALRVARGYVDRTSARGAAGRSDEGLTVLAGLQACYGGAERRFGLEPFAPEEVAAALADDALYLLRPAEEVASLARWSGHPAAAHPTMESFLALRRALAVRGLVTALPQAGWPDAAARVSAMARTLEAWLDAAAGRGKSVARWRARRVARRDEHARIVAALLSRGPKERPLGSGESWTANDADIGLVGTAGVCTVMEAQAWRRRVAEALGRPTGALQGVLSGARRVPPPGGARAAGCGRSDPPLMDRVDVLVGLVERGAGATAAALLGDAVAVLGAVLRDAAVIRRLRAVLPPAFADVRRAATVALGLLGDSSPGDEPLPEDLMDARAVVLAVVLAAPERARAVVERLAREAVRTSMRALLREAAGRLEFGDVLNVVD